MDEAMPLFFTAEKMKTRQRSVARRGVRGSAKALNICLRGRRGTSPKSSGMMMVKVDMDFKASFKRAPAGGMGREGTMDDKERMA